MNESFDLINEKGDVIGQALRTECHGNPKLLHRAVHVIIFHPDTGDILLQKRNMLKDIQPGKWDTAVGGHLNLGEDYLTAAVREMGEELQLPSATPLEYLFDSQIRNEIESENIQVFAAKHPGPFAFQKEEIDTVRFFDTEALRQLVKTPESMTPNLLKELHQLATMGLIQL